MKSPKQKGKLLKCYGATLDVKPSLTGLPTPTIDDVNISGPVAGRLWIYSNHISFSSDNEHSSVGMRSIDFQSVVEVTKEARADSPQSNPIKALFNIHPIQVLTSDGECWTLTNVWKKDDAFMTLYSTWQSVQSSQANGDTPLAQFQCNLRVDGDIYEGALLLYSGTLVFRAQAPSYLMETVDLSAATSIEKKQLQMIQVRHSGAPLVFSGFADRELAYISLFDEWKRSDLLSLLSECDTFAETAELMTFNASNSSLSTDDSYGFAPSKQRTSDGTSTFEFVKESFEHYDRVDKQAVLDSQRRSWTAFLADTTIEGALEADEERVAHMLTQGAPIELRSHVWFNVCSAAKKASSAAPGYYAKLQRQPVPEIAEVIEKDVYRTFPTNEWFAPKLKEEHTWIPALRRILVAYAVRSPETGYCQSMNFLVACMLLVHEGNEERSFWTLCAWIEDLMPNFHSDSMSGSVVDQSVFGALLEVTMPELHAHLDAVGYPISVILVKWLNCCYLLSFPMQTAVRIMDVFVLHGSDTLLEVGLGVMRLIQPMLLGLRGLTEITDCVQVFCQSFYPTHKNMHELFHFHKVLDRRRIQVMRLRYQNSVRQSLAEEGFQVRTLSGLKQMATAGDAELEAAVASTLSKLKQHCLLQSGIDESLFVSSIAKCLPAWSRAPSLAHMLFRALLDSEPAFATREYLSFPAFISALSTFTPSCSTASRLHLIHSMCRDGATAQSVYSLLLALHQAYTPRDTYVPRLQAWFLSLDSSDVFPYSAFESLLEREHSVLLELIHGNARLSIPQQFL